MDNKLLVKTILIVLGLSCLTVAIVQLPALFITFDLTGSKSANIGTSIGGITAPVLNTITIYFIWLTFSAQKKTNEEQNGKNDSDLIMQLSEQMAADYNNFTFVVNKETSQGDVIIKEKKGSSAFIGYCRHIEAATKPYQEFRNSMLGDDILYILGSYEVIMDRINNSSLGEQNKKVLLKKMKLFYDLKLEAPLSILEREFAGETDEYAVFVVTFTTKYR